MKSVKLILLTLIVCLSGISPSHAGISVGGTILSDTTWTSDDTILVTSTVTVAAGVTLDIDPGTVIMLSSFKSLDIYGNINSSGIETQPVIFTSSADTSGIIPTIMQYWYSVYLHQGSTGAFDYCQFRYAYYPIFFDRANSEFHNCVINDFNAAGIFMFGNSSDDPVTATIDRCTIEQINNIGQGSGIYASRRLDLLIHGSKISRCDVGVDLAGFESYPTNYLINNSEISFNDSIGVFIHTCGG